MDWLTFIVEITKALAWPVVALGAAVVFRAELRGALQRLRRGKLGSAEVEFEDRVATLRGKAGEPDPLAANVAATVARDAIQDPRSVILASWLKVQAEVERVIAKHATPEEKRDPAPSLFEFCIAFLALSRNTSTCTTT